MLSSIRIRTLYDKGMDLMRAARPQLIPQLLGREKMGSEATHSN
jgi:hypothetical protein